MTGKQLKNSILQWAIQGKLVPQDSNDEPASVLLERIRAEKARLVKEGKIKKDKNESIIFRGEDNSYYEKFADGKVVCIDDEIPFEIPQNWTWCRISSLFLHASGKQQSSNNSNKGTPQKFITTSNLYWGHFVLDKVKEMYFTDEELKTCSATKGDLLVCEGGAGYGRSAIWNMDYDICLQNHVHRLRPIINGLCEYVLYFIYYLKESNQLASVGTAMPGLSANRLKGLLLPLPPLAEQRRIVEIIKKIDPLLERYSHSQESIDILNNNLKERLKKSIVQEAIQGKLVPQDLDDESVSTLLRRINEEKLRLVKEGKLKKKDIVDSVIFKGDDNKYYEKGNGLVVDISEEIPFEIPDSWTWTRMQQVCSYIHRGKSPRYSEIRKYPVIAQKCNHWDGFYIEKAQFISPDSLSSYSEEQILQDRDLLWNSTGLGTLGRIGLYPSRQNPYNFAVADSHVTVIRSLIEFVRPEYLYYYLSSPTVQNVIEDKSSGSTKQKELATETIKNYLCPIPPIHEQDRIVAQIEKLLYTFK